LDTEAGYGGQASDNTATNGGAGGHVSFAVSGNAQFGAQSGGIQGNTATGDAGNGGNADIVIGGRLTATGTLTVFAGLTQQGHSPTSGLGGDMNFTVGSMDISAAATLRGGLSSFSASSAAGTTTVTLTDNSQPNVFGGNLNLRGEDGDPLGHDGNLYWDNPGADVQVAGNFTLQAGNGHAAGSGAGGEAVFNANTLSLGGTSTIPSGNAGATAAGGNATFSVIGLNAGTGASATLAVTQGNSGVVAFAAGTVNATDGDLALTFANTSSANASIGNLLVGNDQALVVNAPANTMTLTSSLQTNGYDAANPDLLAPSTYTATGPAATNFTGKPLDFAFLLAIASNSTVLTTTNALTLDNTTQVSLSLTGSGPLQLADGDRIVLASNIGGSLYPSRNVTTGGYTFEVLSDGGQLMAIFRGRAAGGQLSDIPVNPGWMLGLMSLAMLLAVATRKTWRG